MNEMKKTPKKRENIFRSMPFMHKNGFPSDTLMVGHFALLQIVLTLSSNARVLVLARAQFLFCIGGSHRCTFIIYDAENKLTGMSKSNRKSYLACKVKYPSIDETRHKHTYS